MMLLLGVVCFILRTGDQGCCHLVVILVIMLTLLRLGWLLKKNAWLWLNASLKVLAYRSCLLIGDIWVHFLALETSSQTTHRITYLSRFKVYHICYQFLLHNLMLHMHFLCMACNCCPNLISIFGLIQTPMICCLL